MKKLIPTLALATMLAIPCTAFAESKEVTPEFNASVIINDDGMTDDYEYKMDDKAVVVKSKESALMVNGEFVPYKGVMQNGTTFVPVRVISESFGKEVKWDEPTQQVTIEDIVLTINNKTAKDGAKDVKLSQAPFVDGGVTYVPLRFIAESLDKEVGYVPKNYSKTTLHNSIVWVEDKEKMDNNGAKPEEIIKWLKPQLYVNKNYFEQVGNEEEFTKESIENMKYLGQLGRYAVFDSAREILVDMETKAVYFSTAGHGFSTIMLQIKDGAYYIYELDMILDLPDEIKGKYYIGPIKEYNGVKRFTLIHKGSADKISDYGLLGTVYGWDKEYSSHKTPIRAGLGLDLYSTADRNYMIQTTSDYQAYDSDEKIRSDYDFVYEVVYTPETILTSYKPIEAEVIPLDYPYKATNEFFFGNWKVDKFLGFGEAYNDDTEQPNGYDIVGKEIVIDYTKLDTTSFNKYPQFQYNDDFTLYEADRFGFENGKGVDFGTNENSQIIEIQAYPNYGQQNYEVLFYVIDNERLVMRVGDRTWYELEKVNEILPEFMQTGVTFALDPTDEYYYYEYGPNYSKEELFEWEKENILKTWKVKKIVGFVPNPQAEAEYPTGPDIVGKKVVLKEDLFSTMDFEGYEKYQKEYQKPVYYQTARFDTGAGLFEYENVKLPGLKSEDQILQISVAKNAESELEPIKFYMVNNKVVYMVWPGGAIYELETVE